MCIRDSVGAIFRLQSNVAHNKHSIRDIKDRSYNTANVAQLQQM